MFGLPSGVQFLSKVYVGKRRVLTDGGEGFQVHDVAQGLVFLLDVGAVSGLV